MDINEILSLATWFEQEVVKRRLAEQYKALADVLNLNAQPIQPQAPFGQQKHALLKTLREISLDRLSLDQIQFLERLSIAPIIGARGANTVEAIFNSNRMDIATAAKSLTDLMAQLSTGSKKINQLKAGLLGLGSATAPNPDSVIVRVAFSGDASMANLVDFKRWASEWHDIGRGIAIAHDMAPEDFRLVGAKRGSIVIELAVAYALARTVSTIILETLKVAERVIDIRKKAEEIRGMKLNNDKIARDMLHEADQEKSKECERITAEVVSMLQLRMNEHGDKINALTLSVRKLAAFLENGGEVDCAIPDDVSAASPDEANDDGHVTAIRELREKITQIRIIETKIKRLGGPQAN